MVVILAVAIIVVAATMTRDSAAVAALDDRRRRCPLSAASSVADDVSSLLSNSITTSGGSSSNGDVGGGDGCSSPKSSSAVSTTTSCCGGSSSSSSRSGSDDDDSVTVARLSTVVNDNCHTSLKTPQLPSLTKDVIDDNNGEKDSSGSSNSSDAGTTTTSTKIGGRLTFYKDGKFIFQLAAHHQQNPYNNRYTSCRWIPVPTVLQQHKNSVKNVGEWPQHQQNKTIWPYLVTNTSSDSVSPQPTLQSQLPAITRIGERKQQQNKHRTTPPPHTEPSTVNMTTHTTANVVASTMNIIRRPPRKCSNTTATENCTNLQPHNWQPQPQLRLVSRRSQHHHQSFMMVATKTIKTQRRLMPKKRRRMPRVSVGKEFSVGEKQQPPLNLECTVRYLWSRRHTELLMRRQMTLNSSGVDCVDSAPPASRHVAGNGDSTCPINMSGGSKWRSAFSPLSNSVFSTVVSTMTTTTSSMSIAENNTGNSSPNKKCRFGQQQQQQQILQPKRPATVDGGAKKSVSSSSPQLSTNDHSITAILSGSAAGAKRNGGVVVATTRANLESCVVTSTTTTATSTVVTPQKNLPSTSAPLSLLRTLLKSPGGAEGGSPTIATSSNDGGGYRQQHTMIGGRKRSAVESSVVSPIQPPPPPVIRPTVDNPGTSMMAFPTVASATSPVNDTTVALSALHQLPTLHHPAAAAAAAGYFNVLYYHQAAMAAAMAYQTHAQLPQPLSKPQLQPSLMSSQFTTIAGSSWQQQLNQRIHLPALERSRANEVTTATISSSPSTVVAPYSSPLVASTVNGGSLLPPATPSPPPLLLHTHPAHNHNLMLHHQQKYLPVPTVQPPLLSSSYQQHRPQSRSVKKRTQMPMGESAVGSVAKVVKEESPSSTDCMPLNLSKDSVGESVNSGASTTAVR